MEKPHLMDLHEYLQSLINEACSLNYTIVSAAPSSSGAQIYYSSDIFGKKTLRQEWYDILIQSMAEIRNKFFSEHNDFIKERTSDSDIAKFRDEILTSLNSIYGEHLTSSDSLFDFENNQQFLADNTYFLMNCPNLVFDEVPLALRLFSKDKIESLQAYNIFIQNYEKDMIELNAFADIMKTLEDDISEYGSKTMFYRKPDPRIVKLIDRETLKNLSTFAKANVAHFEKCAQKVKKQIESLQKEGLFDVNDIAMVSQQFENINLVLAAAQTLASEIEKLQTRLQCSNTSYEPMRSKAMSAVLDFFAPSDSAKKSKVHIDSVYVHKSELQELIYLLGMFQGSESLVAQLSEIQSPSDSGKSVQQDDE